MSPSSADPKQPVAAHAQRDHRARKLALRALISTAIALAGSAAGITVFLTPAQARSSAMIGTLAQGAIPTRAQGRQHRTVEPPMRARRSSARRPADAGRSRLTWSGSPSRLMTGAVGHPAELHLSELLGPGLGSLGSASVGSAPTGLGPSALAVDAATQTIYVANGNNANGPDAGGDTVSVIDARRCNAQDVSRCKGPWPTIKVGNLPSGVAIDKATDTVYVANVGDSTVSVFNGATCNAEETQGCGQTPATVPVGSAPIGIFNDPANHTLYVPNFDNGAGDSTTVSMIDSATCNASDLSACPTTEPPTVDVGAAPDDVDVNQATHTVYVTTIGAVNGWAVFNADTCNATVQSGCGAIGTLSGDPAGPDAGQVDPANNTLYTANYDDTISAFDLRDCDAGDLAGCATDTPGTVTPVQNAAEHALWVVVDVSLHSVYVSYQRDDALFVINTDICNGTHRPACATLTPPQAATGAEPEGVALDRHTQTLYTANETDNDISVIDASRCDATVTSGCRQAPPAVAGQAGGLAADPAIHTLYVTLPNAHAVAMVNTLTCDSRHLTGCASTPPHAKVGTFSIAATVDPLTHTAYVANFGSPTKPGPGSVSVINTATCNATSHAGCARIKTMRVAGGNPDDIEVDAATDTIYVATLTDSGANVLLVFNGASCNATNTAGCNQTPASVQVGDSGGAFSSSQLNIAINHATNTIYATNIAFLGGNFVGDSVYVINGATCDRTDHSGCNQAPAVLTPGNPLASGGLIPWGIAIDQATDTLYVTLEAQGDYAGSVAVINGATCNAQNTNGCNQTPRAVPAGFGASDVAIDPTTQTVYTTNTEDASLSVIDGTTCNRFVNVGCGQTPHKLPAGTYPGFNPGTIVTDPAADTIYVTTANGVSVIPLTH